MHRIFTYFNSSFNREKIPVLFVAQRRVLEMTANLEKWYPFMLPVTFPMMALKIFLVFWDYLVGLDHVVFSGFQIRKTISPAVRGDMNVKIHDQPLLCYIGHVEERRDLLTKHNPTITLITPCGLCRNVRDYCRPVNHRRCSYWRWTRAYPALKLDEFYPESTLIGSYVSPRSCRGETDFSPSFRSCTCSPRANAFDGLLHFAMVSSGPAEWARSSFRCLIS